MLGILITLLRQFFTQFKKIFKDKFGQQKFILLWTVKITGSPKRLLVHLIRVKPSSVGNISRLRNFDLKFTVPSVNLMQWLISLQNLGPRDLKQEIGIVCRVI